ncbi:MAG: UDP-N-acetylglucosamine 1-carboxyvinyltransferase [Coriobacteriales bacterium]|nr:UDP-N-acetylglucosamine 1-carboxyvinyltransferase [Coriobacteriales bacterium]
MDKEVIKVRGGNRLCGKVHISGAKNSVLKLMAASILADGTSTITNVPNISDVHMMAEVLEHLGAHVSPLQNGRLSIDASKVEPKETPYDLVNKLRASIAVLGPLLARFGEATVSMPGGCLIGSRSINMHLDGLASLGVTNELVRGNIVARTKLGTLNGANVRLPFASVGATENLMLAATRAQGITTIENAAREPEIVDLANFLIQMGVNIVGAGSPTICVYGAECILPVQEYKTVGDRIEAGTYLVAGALTGGPITVTGVCPQHLLMPLRKLREFGCHCECSDDGVDNSSITIRGIDLKEGSTRLKPTDIQTLPYPGFPTDLQPQFMVLAAIANGSSVITENVFENRFMFANELNRMGAEISIEGHHALIKGVRNLSGAPVEASDLRAGAGLLLAGLVAEGTSIVNKIGHIDRGYEQIVDRLAALGADIERLTL